ncbi:MAG TPA: EamA family transporter [Streptosporangiaceae bacterium]
MTSVLGGIGTALIFTTATVCASRSTRMIGPTSVLSWVMLVGLVILGPVVAASGVPPHLQAGSFVFLAVAGVTNVLGLLLAYRALRIGKVGVVAPVLSTQGAVAALIAVAAGESIGPGAAAALGVVAAGVFLTAATREDQPGQPAALVFAAISALCFGTNLYTIGKLGGQLPVAWVLLPARILAVAAVAAPLAATSRLRITRRALPLVVAGGICEVAGFSLFTVSARHGIAVTAVLASSFPALSALAAYVLFREKLGRLQIAGAATIVIGVLLLGGLQA